ncbi:MAG: hypothetical protein NT036_02900, partial [Candidatus Omnitrophica bacterium]|nr:hypothetical protein [Candidatus Omnitrophota bacterium]
MSLLGRFTKAGNHYRNAWRTVAIASIVLILACSTVFAGFVPGSIEDQLHNAITSSPDKIAAFKTLYGFTALDPDDPVYAGKISSISAGLTPATIPTYITSMTGVHTLSSLIISNSLETAFLAVYGINATLPEDTYVQKLYSIVGDPGYNQTVYGAALQNTYDLHLALAPYRTLFGQIYGINPALQDPASNSAYRTKLFDIVGAPSYGTAGFINGLIKLQTLHDALNGLRSAFNVIFGVAPGDQVLSNAVYRGKLSGLLGDPAFNQSLFLSSLPKAADLHVALDPYRTEFQNAYGVSTADQNPVTNDTYRERLFGIVSTSGYSQAAFLSNLDANQSLHDALAGLRSEFQTVYNILIADQVLSNTTYSTILSGIRGYSNYDQATFLVTLPNVKLLNDAIQAATDKQKTAFTTVYGVSLRDGFKNVEYRTALFGIVGGSSFDAGDINKTLVSAENVVTLHNFLLNMTQAQRDSFGSIFGVIVQDTLNVKKEGLIFRNLPTSGQYTFTNPLTSASYSWGDFDARSGDNAWLAISQLQIAYQKYGASYHPEKMELVLAERIARAAMDLMVNDIGGLMMTNDVHSDFYNVVSTENVISWYAAFKMLYEVSGKDEYRLAMENMLKYLEHYAFDAGTNTFISSTKKTGGIWTPSSVFATDCQTWAIASLGPEKIDQMFGAGTAYNMWQAALLSAGQYVGGVLKGLAYSTGESVISIEWTAGGIEAALKIADYYKISNPAWSNAALQDAINMRQGIESYKADTAAGTTGYSYSSGRIEIPFGWYSHSSGVLSTASTSWVSFLTSGFDPFVLGGTIPMYGSLPGLTPELNLMNWLSAQMSGPYNMIGSYSVPAAIRAAILAEIQSSYTAITDPTGARAAAEAAFVFNGSNIYDEALALMSLYRSGNPALIAIADNISKIFWEGTLGDIYNITNATGQPVADISEYTQELFNIIGGPGYNETAFLSVLPKVLNLNTELLSRNLKLTFVGLFPTAGDYVANLFGVAGGASYDEAVLLSALSLDKALSDAGLKAKFIAVYPGD